MVILPIVIPFLGAVTCLFAWRHPAMQQGVAIAASAGQLIAAAVLLIRVSNEGILTVGIGNWPAPVGIVLVADLFAALMLVATTGVAFCVTIYSLVTIDPERRASGYFVLLNFLLLGTSATFLTGDVFNLFVWFEVTLLASFLLMALGTERSQMEASIKYVSLNLVSSFVLLVAIGLLYALTGTLNMADLALKLGDSRNAHTLTAIAMLFLFATGVKAAIFPLFFWLPASYHTPPLAITALFAGLLTKIGVYAIIRLFTLVFVQDISFTTTAILTLSAFTMVTGVLGAIAQNEMRRLLSFHVVSQIGYMTMGLGFFTAAGLSAAIFFMIHNIITKTSLFLVAGVVHRLQGSFDLRALGGIYERQPLYAALFLVPALSLAGIPPLSGFMGKLALVKAGVQAEEYAILGVALVVSLLTLFSMMKIWRLAFWGGAQRVTVAEDRTPLGMLFPVVILVSLTVAMGLAAQPILELTERSGAELIARDRYIDAVLGQGEAP